MERENLLIQRAKSGDSSAFRQLVEKNKRKIYGLCFELTGEHESANDLSQEVFVKAFQNLETFRGEAGFSSWLYRIAVNLHINQTRKKMFSRLFTRETNYFDRKILEANYSDPERNAEARLIRENIENALAKLAPRERAIFVLRHHQDLPLKEIAEILKIKVGTVKSLLFRAIKKLQKELSFYKEDFFQERFDE